MKKNRGSPIKTVNVGLIGFGYIGKIHTLAYRSIPLCIQQPLVAPNLAALLRSRLDKEVEAVQSAGFDLATTQPEEFFSLPLDLVDVCTPNHLHWEQCRAALQAGLAVYCEKPLGRTLEEARSLADLAEKEGALTQVAFVLRYVPAMRAMKALIEAGEIGEVLHFRGHLFHGSYLNSNRPMSWRLRWSQSGGGAFMDLGAHLVDATHYLLGRPSGLRAEMRTFIRERFTSSAGVQKETVDVDDWAQCTLELASGAVGVLEVTRVAAGASQASGFEVFGSKGALRYAERNPEAVQFYSVRRGEWISGPANQPALPGERPIDQLWPGGKFSLGSLANAHLAAQYDLLLNLAEGKPSRADFRSACQVQETLEAAYRSAAQGGESIRLEA